MLMIKYHSPMILIFLFQVFLSYNSAAAQDSLVLHKPKFGLTIVSTDKKMGLNFVCTIQHGFKYYVTIIGPFAKPPKRAETVVLRFSAGRRTTVDGFAIYQVGTQFFNADPNHPQPHASRLADQKLHLFNQGAPVQSAVLGRFPATRSDEEYFRRQTEALENARENGVVESYFVMEEAESKRKFNKFIDECLDSSIPNNQKPVLAKKLN